MPDVPDEPFVAVVKLRIAKARAAAGLTQVQVAHRLNMSERDYQRYERPSSRNFNPTLRTLRALAAVLEVDPATLITTPTPEELQALEEAHESRGDRQH